MKLILDVEGNIPKNMGRNVTLKWSIFLSLIVTLLKGQGNQYETYVPKKRQLQSRIPVHKASLIVYNFWTVNNTSVP